MSILHAAKYFPAPTTLGCSGHQYYYQPTSLVQWERYYYRQLFHQDCTPFNIFSVAFYPQTEMQVSCALFAHRHTTERWLEKNIKGSRRSPKELRVSVLVSKIVFFYWGKERLRLVEIGSETNNYHILIPNKVNLIFILIFFCWHYREHKSFYKARLGFLLHGHIIWILTIFQ